MSWVEQRDKVVQADAYGRLRIETADAGHGIVQIAFKQAGNVNQVGLQAGKKGFANQFSGLSACIVVRVLCFDRAGGRPDADVFWR